MSINNLAFNQDYSYLSVSTSTGYRIFNCDPFGEFYSSTSSHDPERDRDRSSPTNPNGANGNVNYSRNGSFTANTNQYSSRSVIAEHLQQPTSFMKMLFLTSLTVIVPLSPFGDRLLKLYNLKQNLKICELTFPAHIVNVLLNRKRLCVMLESGQLYIYDLSCVRLMKVLEIASLPREDSSKDQPVSQPKLHSTTGYVADLSADDKSYLVLPLVLIKSLTDIFNREGGNVVSQPSTPLLRPSVQTLASVIEDTHKSKPININIAVATTVGDLNKHSKGWILVYDTINLKPKLIYKAHDTNIAKVAISSDASKIATASAKGTIIRVGTVVQDEDAIEVDDELGDDKLKLHNLTQLRRGHNVNNVSITCLAFSLDNNVLGSASQSGTIHFFRLHDSETLLDPSLDDDSLAEMARSSEDLNDNLALLLITEETGSTGRRLRLQLLLHLQHEDDMETSPVQQLSSTGYFHFKNMPLLNNTYTKSLVKKLPYKGYLENLLEPPRRSFAYVKIPEPEGGKVEIGFTSASQVLLASYKSGKFYHFQLPMSEREREEAVLIAEYLLE